MKRAIVAAFTLVMACAMARSAFARDDSDASALVDKAIKAMGGQEQLSKIKAASWSTKGTISFQSADNSTSGKATIQGVDHLRQDVSLSVNGMDIKVIILVSGGKGTFNFNGNPMDMDADALANQKRLTYLTAIPMTLVALKSKDFKLAPTADATVGGKPAAGIQVTGPEGKTFKLYFDKDTGLPAQTVATVMDFMGAPFTQTTTFTAYKDIAGIKVAMHVSSKRDGDKFIESDISDFKVLDMVDPKTFTDAG